MQMFSDANSIKEAKKLLRKDLKAKRDAMDLKVREAYSQCVVEKVLSTEAYENAKVIFSFYPMQSELRIDKLFPTAAEDGKTLVFPVCFAKGRMEAYKPKSWSDMDLDSFGIPAPDPDLDLLFDPSQIDLCLVPMLTYDRSLYRLGYGGGFYDRFIPRLRDSAAIIGVAFSDLEVEVVPRDSFDIALPVIINEKEIIESRNEP